jgi:hypothetical protein
MSDFHEVLTVNSQPTLVTEVRETLLAMHEGRTPNLDVDALKRMDLLADVIKRTIAKTVEYSADMRENALVLTGLFGTDSEDVGEYEHTAIELTSGSDYASDSEHQDAAETVSALVLGNSVTVSKTDEKPANFKAPQAKKSTTSDDNRSEKKAEEETESRSVDWDEVERVLNETVLQRHVGEQLKAAVFLSQPYFVDIIGEDGKGLRKAKSRLSNGIAILVNKGVLRHNGKPRGQSAYEVLEQPIVVEDGADFLAR